MSLREHLGELRRRFKIVFISFVVMLLAFLVVPANPAGLVSYATTGSGNYYPLIGFFMARVKLDLLPRGWELLGLGVSQALEIYLIASLIFALIFNAPIFAYEVVAFIRPGLKENEKGLIFPFAGATAALFGIGCLFGFFFLAKFLLIAMSPFFAVAQLQTEISGLDFYSIVFLTVGLSGFAFTIPVYIYTLIRLGVIQATTFTKNRLIVWAATYILTAIITPDGGPILDVILFVPIIVLLEIAVFFGGRAAKSKAKKAAKDANNNPPAPSTSSAPSSPSPPAAPAASTVPAPPEAAAIVPTTGFPVSTTRVCSYCKHELAPDTVFCPNCGRANE
jgi:sec-independent protein translocase protein TatC